MNFSQIFLICLMLMTGLSFAMSFSEEVRVNNESACLVIPRTLLFGNPEKTSAQLSPDGTKIAFLAPDKNNVLNVWVRDVVNSGKEMQITKDARRGIRQFFWQYDQKHILYIQDQEGDENWHLYQTTIDTQETKDLTPFSGIKVELLAKDPHFPDTILLTMNKRDPQSMDVYRLYLPTGELQMDTQNPGGVFSWEADHALQVRMCKSYLPDGSTLIRIRDHKDSPWRDWLQVGPMDSVEIQNFSADNQHVYLMSNLESDTKALYKMHIVSKEKVLLAKDQEYDLSTLFLNPLTYVPEMVSVEKEKPDWVVLDPQLKTDFHFLSTRCKGPFYLASRDIENQRWIVVSQSDQRPSHFYIYHRKTGSFDFLFSSQPELEKYVLSPMKPISFKARDGMILHGYVTLPSHKSSRNLPTVLLVHGGPWARDFWGLSSQVQWLANRGYAVLQINYRGSEGYGKKFLNAGNKEWANAMHADLLDGKKWMIEQGYTDPEKVAIYGGSYGGYATLVALTFTPEEFCCGVDIVGPSNLITLLQTLPPYWNPLKAVMDLRIGKLESEIDFLKSRSPLFKADQIKKPLLIAQGANDPRVKQAESDQIVRAMREKSIPVNYLLFGDEGHGFARPENRLKFYAATEAFLAKHLGGIQEAASAEENWESVLR